MSVFLFSLSLYSPLDLGPFFSFLTLYTVGRTPWKGISPSQGRYLTQTSMPRVGFETTTPVFERASKDNGISARDLLCLLQGRAIAQVVSGWLPTTAARVRSQVKSRGICGGESGTGVGFPLYFDFPCQFSFHQLLHTHNLSSVAGTIGQ
jgi:hypothetical protein